MNPIKIGKLIAECRKEKNMTQRQLADFLAISDKTVSKWECGKGLPDASFMLPLCEILHVSVNELLSGERLTSGSNQAKAKETGMKPRKETEYSKSYKGLMVWILSFTILSLLFCFQFSVTENSGSFVKIMLIVFMLMIDFLFFDIYRGEFVYWITYGPDFHTAKEAGTKARKKYAGQYVKTFLIASGIWMIYLLCSIIFALSTKLDVLTFFVIFGMAGLCTIPIKFTAGIK